MKLFEIPLVVTSLVGLGFLAGLDAPARADFTFGAPVDVHSDYPYVSPADEWTDCFSADGLEVYFESWGGRPVGYGGPDIWVSKRASVEDDWGAAENLGPLVNGWGLDGHASISADGLELYFHSNRPGGHGEADLYVTRRATRTSPWEAATNLGPRVNTAQRENLPAVSPDGLELYFSSNRPGGYGSTDAYVSRRATRNDPWGAPVNLGLAVNSPGSDDVSSLSPHGLLLVFGSDRPGGFGAEEDGYMTRRASRSAPWQPALNLGPVVNRAGYNMPGMSADGSALHIVCNPNGIWTEMEAPILPIVDFDGDGRVDGKEVLALAQHWGQSKSLYDIGLSPMGDGVVDVNDLTVLAGYIGQEVNDPSLVAHWAMDETTGTTATDSAGDNDAMVFGGAAWQPADGKVAGALAFDGEDDFARSPSPALDPAKGPLSVIAWVKGEAANKAIISQSTGMDWLYLNQLGMLTTDLKSSGKEGKPLTSDAYVLDDQWHRVVLTWDGRNRTLQMDGVEVARDTQPNLASSSGVLHMGAGAGKTLASPSFWTGLIDDVRVYNRAVAP